MFAQNLAKRLLMVNLPALIVIPPKELNKMEELKIKLDGDAVLKRLSAIEYFSQLRQIRYPHISQNNCQRVVDEKEKEAILNNNLMSSYEIYCRKRMYQSLIEAQKCMNCMDADGFLNNINVARGLSLGHVRATELLNSYEDKYRDHFHNIGLVKARLAADTGDVNGAFYCIDQVDKVAHVSFFDRTKIERIARQNARKSEAKTRIIETVDESEIKTRVIGSKKEHELLTLLGFSYKGISYAK